MPRLLFAGRNPVAVDIKQPWRQDAQARQPTFLLRLLYRHREQVQIAIGVTAELEPLVQFAMVREQGQPTRRINNPS